MPAHWHIQKSRPCRQRKPPAERSGSLLVMACALAGILLVEVLLCLTPPVSRDALIHHLAIPKLWIRHGGFFEMPWADFSYFPMNIDLLYLVPLLFGNDVLPALIHMLFGWGTGYLVYRYLKKHAGRIWGMLGLLLFVTTSHGDAPVRHGLCGSGDDLFTTASVLSCVRWRDGGYEDVMALLAGACIGLAAGSKYNAMISWLFLNGAVFYLYAKDTGKQPQALQCGALFSLVGLRLLAVAGEKSHPDGKPNLPPAGQPLCVYPRRPWTGRFSCSRRSGERGLQFLPENRTLLYGEDAWQVLLLPCGFFWRAGITPRALRRHPQSPVCAGDPLGPRWKPKRPPVLFFPVCRICFSLSVSRRTCTSAISCRPCRS